MNIEKNIDKQALSQWKNSETNHSGYLSYIKSKRDKFAITFIDLLYVRNFKGGNSSINGDETSIDNKLKEYSEHLRRINQLFGDKSLGELTKDEVKTLIERANEFIKLTAKDTTAINGFKSSYASTLLHFHFPKLIPILDRRVLNGANIKANKDKYGQIIDIKEYYPNLIEKFYDYLSKNSDKSIRDFDKECFIKLIKG